MISLERHWVLYKEEVGQLTFLPSPGRGAGGEDATALLLLKEWHFRGSGPFVGCLRGEKQIIFDRTANFGRMFEEVRTQNWGSAGGLSARVAVPSESGRFLPGSGWLVGAGDNAARSCADANFTLEKKRAVFLPVKLPHPYLSVQSLLVCARHRFWRQNLCVCACPWSRTARRRECKGDTHHRSSHCPLDWGCYTFPSLALWTRADANDDDSRSLVFGLVTWE